MDILVLCFVLFAILLAVIILLYIDACRKIGSLREDFSNEKRWADKFEKEIRNEVYSLKPVCHETAKRVFANDKVYAFDKVEYKGIFGCASHNNKGQIDEIAKVVEGIVVDKGDKFYIVFLNKFDENQSDTPKS